MKSMIMMIMITDHEKTFQSYNHNHAALKFHFLVAHYASPFIIISPVSVETQRYIWSEAYYRFAAPQLRPHFYARHAG